MAKLLIKGGRVIDPLNKVDKVGDLLIDKGKVTQIGDNLKSQGQVVNANNKMVCPGLVDMHVHLREPGREDEETIETASRAAIAGGITSLACMPNTDPVVDNEAIAESIIDKAKEVGLVDVYPVGAITKGLEGESLSEMAHLAEAGAVAFSDDGKTVMDAHLMRRAFEYAKVLDKPLIVHCEDTSLSSDGQINEGYYSTFLGLKGIPAEAEEFIVARDLMLAKLTGAKVHITHVSTAGSVALIREAKKTGVKATADVTPHHLLLDESQLSGYDTNLKVAPPLRSKEDQIALIEGLKDGTIDAIASDHAPHGSFEKEREFIYAPCGVVGLETMLSLVLTKLDLKLPLLLEKLTSAPANILGIEAGNLSKGTSTDVLIIDPKAKVKVNGENFYSKSKNTPFNGYQLQGQVYMVIKRGNIVFKEGKFVES